MTKKELIEMISEIPDDAVIQLLESRNDLLSINSYNYQVDIKGFYENKGAYILCSLNVRPYKILNND